MSLNSKLVAVARQHASGNFKGWNIRFHIMAVVVASVCLYIF